MFDWANSTRKTRHPSTRTHAHNHTTTHTFVALEVDYWLHTLIATTGGDECRTRTPSLPSAVHRTPYSASRSSQPAGWKQSTGSLSIDSLLGQSPAILHNFLLLSASFSKLLQLLLPVSLWCQEDPTEGGKERMSERHKKERKN